MSEPPPPGSAGQDRGSPVGRRTVLGIVALGGLGVATGSRVQNALARFLAPIQSHDPTGLTNLIPLGDTFRYYTVTGSVRRETPATYRLPVSGLVAQPSTYSFAELEALPQTKLVREFQCVTGWRVPDVHWVGVRLSTLLARARPKATATAVLFRSFDGTYTESLTLDEAMRPDVIVALQMLGQPVTHDHGGPVRMYCGSMYGYKSTKWLSEIELTDRQIPGYWEPRGYDIDGSYRN
jgi:DMSO/TMAO reductase YedYZ molybdopterin-dependent catalytic subunit